MEFLGATMQQTKFMRNRAPSATPGLRGEK